MLSKSRFGLLAVAGLIALIIPLALVATEVYSAPPRRPQAA